MEHYKTSFKPPFCVVQWTAVPRTVKECPRRARRELSGRRQTEPMRSRTSLTAMRLQVIRPASRSCERQANESILRTPRFRSHGRSEAPATGPQRSVLSARMVDKITGVQKDVLISVS